MKVDLDSISQALSNREQSYYLDVSTGRVYSQYELDYIIEKEYPDEEIDDYSEIGLDLVLIEAEYNYGYAAMEMFIISKGDADYAPRLERAIQGKGAFRRFRTAVNDLGLESEWYLYLDEFMANKAREWCKDNEIDIKEKRRMMCGGPMRKVITFDAMGEIGESFLIRPDYAVYINLEFGDIIYVDDDLGDDKGLFLVKKKGESRLGDVPGYFADFERSFVIPHEKIEKIRTAFESGGLDAAEEASKDAGIWDEWIEYLSDRATNYGREWARKQHFRIDESDIF